MWKAITLVLSSAAFALIGLLVEWNKADDFRAWGAILGCLAGFAVGYLSIVIAVSSDKPK